MNRILRLVGPPLGIAVVVWLVLETHPAAIFSSVARIGWGFVAIVAARLATVVIDCGAWRCLLPRSERPSFAVMLPLRWIAESINTTLPVAQIGGEVVRARLLQRLLVAPSRGAASVAVDFCLSLLAQILFTLLGFVLLAASIQARGGRQRWRPLRRRSSPFLAGRCWSGAASSHHFSGSPRASVKGGWQLPCSGWAKRSGCWLKAGRRWPAL